VSGGPGVMLLSPGPVKTGAAGLWTSADSRVWKRVPLLAPTFRPGDVPMQLSQAGRWLVLTGYCAAPCSPGSLTGIWVSKDGTNWQRGAMASGVALGPVVGGGDGLIALGNPGSRFTSLWTSADGLKWRRLSRPDQVFGTLARVSALVNAGPRLVAGGIILTNPKGGPGQHAAIWTSRDGRTWALAPGDHGLFATPGIMQLLAGPHSVLALDGRLSWSSADGQNWRKGSPSPAPVDGAGADSITAWKGGFVALVGEGGEDALWSSQDGLTWTRVGSNEIFGGTAQVDGVAGVGNGLVATGRFAPLPPPACLRPPSAAFVERRSFQPATFRWSPAQSQAAPPPTGDSSDPRIMKLLPKDFPPSVGTINGSGGFYQGAYVDLCPLDPALGSHRAYMLAFGVASHVDEDAAFSIETPDATAAGAAFQKAAGLIVLPYLDATVDQTQELSAPVRIGQETRLFRVQVKRGCGDADLLSRMQQCTTTSVWSYAVAWRQGRAIGVVVMTDRQLAIQLAMRQLARLEHPEIPSGWRLVARRRTPAASFKTASARTAMASKRCSQLSRTRSASREARWATRSEVGD